MRFLITGTSGQLGYDIIRELQKRNYNEYLGVGKEEMDITNEESVMKTITEYKPDIIFHCAAYTAVDRAEDCKEEAYAVNVEGTKNIVNGAKKVNAKIIYISTDYVFDGTKEGLYEIEDPVNPQSIYGKTKLEGENLVKTYANHFIVRTSWVFGIHGNNFVKTMLRLSESKEELSVVKDQVGSPTYTVDLAKALVDIALTEKYGTYHINNEGYCSWAEFAKTIFKVNHRNVKVNPIPTSEYKTKATRPLNSKLSKKALTENGFSLLPSFEDALERYKEELEKESI